MPTLPPALVQRYEVRAALGAGGMGAVYRALDRELGREVALKLILGEPDPRRLKRFEREAAITAALNHPHVVKLHAMQVVDEVPYLTYELVPGARTLDEVLPTVSLRRGVELLRDAARGLAYAHGEGVVHRDVKPQNLLVDQAGTLKVADFGLAIAADVERLTRTGAMIGSPCYMAPELTASKEGGAEPSTDVWSLGVILYELLTGELPFVANNLMELAKRIASAEATPPSRIDRAVDRSLEAVCLQALRKDPSQRYPDAGAFADDLDAWLQDRPVTATPASGVNVFIRRHRRAATLAVPVLVGVALLALAFNYRPDPTPSPAASPSAPASASAAPSPSPSPSATDAAAPVRRVAELRHAGPGVHVQVCFVAGELLTAGQDGRVRRWDLSRGRAVQVWNVGTPLEALCVLPRGGWAAAGLRQVVIGGDGRKTLLRHRIGDALLSIAASLDGSWVAAGGRSGRVVLLPTDPARFPTVRAQSLVHKAPISGVGFLTLGEVLTVAGSRVDLSPSLENNAVSRWSIESGELLRSVGTGYNPSALDARGGVVAVGSTWGQAILYHPDLKVRHSLIGQDAPRALGAFSSGPASHRGAVYALRLTLDAERLYSVSGPIDNSGANELRGWDVKTYEELFLQPLETTPCAIDISEDGKRLAIGTRNGTATVWELGK